MLTLGSTHVAVGFVDAGGLTAACFTLMSRDPRVATAAAGGGAVGLAPLTWVGYEMSVPSVAKTLVVLQMLQRGAPVDHVLQV